MATATQNKNAVNETTERIRDLKKIYDLDHDSRASHRLRERTAARPQKAKK